MYLYISKSKVLRISVNNLYPRRIEVLMSIVTIMIDHSRSLDDSNLPINITKQKLEKKL